MNYFEAIYNQGLEKNAEHITNRTYNELKSAAYVGDKQARVKLKALARNNPELLNKYEKRDKKQVAGLIVGSGTLAGGSLGHNLQRGIKRRIFTKGRILGGIAGLAGSAYGAKKYLESTKGYSSKVVDALRRHGALSSMREDIEYMR